MRAMYALGERDERSGLADGLRGAAAVSLTLPAARAAVVARVALLSPYLGFFPECKGLAPGGGAGVGQVQRLPPFSTPFASVLTEQVDANTVAAIAVRVVAGIGRRMPIASSAT
jgi:hypothetical protein